eukprot:4519295-Pleurochrysis_carterae.AAC.2
MILIHAFAVRAHDGRAASVWDPPAPPGYCEAHMHCIQHQTWSSKHPSSSRTSSFLAAAPCRSSIGAQPTCAAGTAPFESPNAVDVASSPATRATATSFETSSLASALAAGVRRESARHHSPKGTSWGGSSAFSGGRNMRPYQTRTPRGGKRGSRSVCGAARRGVESRGLIHSSHPLPTRKTTEPRRAGTDARQPSGSMICRPLMPLVPSRATSSSKSSPPGVARA